MERERLEQMLTKLKLTSIRVRFDNLLDEASNQKMTLFEAVAYLCKEIAHKDHHRIQMSTNMAKFPFQRSFGALIFKLSPL